ncbi:MAG: hypothetical protein ACI9JM_003198 [Halioglobus sp.]|jgi:hypothetical protein
MNFAAVRRILIHRDNAQCHASDPLRRAGFALTVSDREITADIKGAIGGADFTNFSITTFRLVSWR